MRIARRQRYEFYGDDSPTLSPSDLGTGTSTLDPTTAASSPGISLPQLWGVSVISGLSVYFLTRWLDNHGFGKRSP